MVARGDGHGSSDLFLFRCVRYFGCVLAELLLGQPHLPWGQWVDQLVEIIR